jgi:Kef-type K+ transport system membrane component KefB
VRRIFVLGLLVVGMWLTAPLGAPSYGSQALLAFGFLILAAYAAGEIAVGLRLPKLVGYMLAGVAFGPSALGTVSARALADLEPVSSLAIALIAFLAGSELRWKELRERGRTILGILGVELALTLAVVTAFLILLRDHVSFLQGDPWREVLAFSLVFASIAAVHSPAVVMALLTETRADGPVSRTSLGVVLVSDVVAVLLLTGTLAFARFLVPPISENVPALTIGAVAWEVGGAVLVGGAIGGLVTIYLRFVSRELFLFAMMVALFGSEIATLLHVEPLLTLITAGFVTENVSLPEHGAALRSAMERAAAPVFVVFFALAGGQIALAELASVWPLVLPLAIVRAFAIWSGSRAGIRLSGARGPEADAMRKHVWAGLIPQAGVAIGLAAVVAQTYPQRGSQIRTLFLALVAVNQALGPVLFRRALDRSREIPDHSPLRGDEVPPFPFSRDADQGVAVAAGGAEREA